MLVAPANGATLTSGGLFDFEIVDPPLFYLASNLSMIDVLYDADGNRVKETIGAQTISLLVDLETSAGYAQVVEERVNGRLVRTYTNGHALLNQTEASVATWVATLVFSRWAVRRLG